MQINVYLTNLVVLGSRCNKSGGHWVPNLILYEFMFPWSIIAIFAWPWKMFSVSVRYLFYQPMDEKIKTWTRRFPAKENPNMEKVLLDWPMVLQCDFNAKFRLISRKFFGHEVFHLSVRLINQKPRCVCIRSTNQSNRSISARRLFLFCLHVFISRSYENSSIVKSSV